MKASYSLITHFTGIFIILFVYLLIFGHYATNKINCIFNSLKFIKQ